VSPNDPVLNLEKVRFHWPGRAGFSLAVDQFSVGAKEKVLLLGESGSGKSTLLSLICGTVLAQKGSVHVAGTNLADLNGGQRDRFRAETIGVIFQQFNLLPFGSVTDNVLLPLQFAPKRRKRVQNPATEAKRLCQELGLPSSLQSERAATLSVGQQQRVAVARALIGDPPLILADEPTSSLDAGSQANFLDLMFQQVDANGAAVLMVSHDPRLAGRFDRIIEMKDIAISEREST
jgi:putative ABC transport system ATP-binding protein